MITIALCSFLIGATIGIRLKIAALLPAVILGIGVVVPVALLKASTASSAINAIIVWTICLQLGYLLGPATRFCLAAARFASRRSISSTAVRS